ncbi:MULTISPECIES: phosphonate C-P lyase system protein PhnG [unclassified Achromobacter]|uniref:phosphonate C-P lyase system protein PhnG n=1 Tax=unclassified Achromobacter TaxID=2626865 RepID=UPI000B517D39|nr:MULTISPECIES: phosphonate C-P lyase system protein PhnG [unclassified Achromobacter]OWT75313.1 phosphonate C-P lyase system protein PhnG [Achromobacter sp. HZ28]OWT75972.1 phosphonate C-P lyase system protein PhnG [Achromobacter sp. HZ34]
MDTHTPETGSQAARSAWMRVLALADGTALDQAYQALGPLPAFRPLRAPEVGMTMVRGRAGGTGEQFNLGEMSVTRCAVAFEQGVVGTAYVQGRSLRHAEQAAVLDGLLQMDDWYEAVQTLVVAPLARVHEERRARRAAAAAQTRVEFFTMVRGEN